MLNNWSEHYRGIEVKFIRKVPQAVIDERIKSAKSRIEYAKAELKELQAMEPSKTDIRVIERRKRQRKMNKIYKEKGLTNLIQPIE
jgi:hypothetical protein